MKKKRSEGFTLIEVIVVAGIIAILAGVLVPMILKEIDESRITRASADIRSIASAILVFKKDTAQWPLMDEGCNPVGTLLYGNGVAPAGLNLNGWSTESSSSIDDHLAADDNECYNNWKGPYLPIASADPWGNQYVINADKFATAGVPVWIISAGPNGRLDTNAINIATFSDDIGTRLK